MDPNRSVQQTLTASWYKLENLNDFSLQLKEMMINNLYYKKRHML